MKVDGYVTKLPEGTEGIIVLNLPSYSGGVNIWGDHLEEKVFYFINEKERRYELEYQFSRMWLLTRGYGSNKQFRPQSVEDKLLEVAGVTSVYHLVIF
jgi:hypothetical protein